MPHPSEKPDPYLVRIANEVVAHVRRSMPAELRQLAEAVPVIFESYPSEDVIAEGFEPDILGLFVGEPVNSEGHSHNPLPAAILLYLASIWDYADGNMAAFRKEVRLTYLHELGHYLGWDEEQVAAHGLE